jgi:hypothetical protein
VEDEGLQVMKLAVAVDVYVEKTLMHMIVLLLLLLFVVCCSLFALVGAAAVVAY